MNSLKKTQETIPGDKEPKILQKIFSKDNIYWFLALIPALFFFIYYLFVSGTLYFRSDDFAHLNINKALTLKKAFSFAGQYSSNANLYRPTTNVFFRLNQEVFGYDPMPYTLEMILFSIVIFVFAFLVIDFFIKKKYLSTLLATIFILSPFMLEPMTWYANVCDTFGLLFLLPSLYLFLRFRSNRYLLIASSSLLFLALISKEPFLAAAPLFLFLIAFAKENISVKIKQIIVFLVPVSGYLFIRQGYSTYIAEHALKVNYTGFVQSKFDLYVANAGILVRKLLFIPDDIIFNNYLLIGGFALLLLLPLLVIRKYKVEYLAFYGMLFGSILINMMTPIIFDRYLALTYFSLIVLLAIMIVRLEEYINYSLFLLFPLLLVNTYFFAYRFNGVVESSEIAQNYIKGLAINEQLYDVPYAQKQVLVFGKYTYNYYNLIFSEKGHISLACNSYFKISCYVKELENQVIIEEIKL